MFRIVTREFEFGFEWNGVSESSFDTFLDGVSRWVYEIVEELEVKDISSIVNWEVFLKNLEQAFIGSFVNVGFKLEEFFEGL